MQINPTPSGATSNPVTNAKPGPASPTVASSRKIASDFETFLKMLTTQMKNQDPLNPVKSSDFAVQLATFSGVEQQVRTNDLLQSMANQFGLGGLSQITSWVGLEARAPTAVTFSGQPVDVFMPPSPDTGQPFLSVRDATGAEVQRLPYSPSDGPLQWAGVDAAGKPFPPGRYSFFLDSYDKAKRLSSEQAQVFAPVSEVRLENGGPVAVFPGGASVPATSVTAIRAPGG